VDDKTRLAYALFLPDESARSAWRFLLAATRFYRSLGISVERVLTDNGACFRSQRFGRCCGLLDMVPKKTRPYRPQTNGKVERLNRTLMEEWAYAQEYASDAQRECALPAYLYYYNNQRRHLGLKGQTPIEALKSSLTCRETTASITQYR
jgi:transposase InsO family protein